MCNFESHSNRNDHQVYQLLCCAIIECILSLFCSLSFEEEEEEERALNWLLFMEWNIDINTNICQYGVKCIKSYMQFDA